MLVDCTYVSSGLEERTRLVKEYFPIGIIVSINKDFNQEMIFTKKEFNWCSYWL